MKIVFIGTMEYFPMITHFPLSPLSDVKLHKFPLGSLAISHELDISCPHTCRTLYWTCLVLYKFQYFLYERVKTRRKGACTPSKKTRKYLSFFKLCEFNPEVQSFHEGIFFVQFSKFTNL